ncbi:PrsW family glutamic-type intramembrane protease [Enterococcus sp. AZ103]|uniref:PrsW family glutamic-type intramembrane protease n=1 Tax=Enterococcus sp. AZ103 TaxID=2774628 RepID=UPI003F21267B
MKNKLILVIALFLFAVGFDYELLGLAALPIKNQQYLILLISFLLVALFLIPATYLFYRLEKKFKLPYYFFPLALVCGYFMPGWLAAYGNQAGVEILHLVFGNGKFIKAWQDALTAPIVEESVKFLVVFLLLKLLKVRRSAAVFILGMAVGLGFQFSEDVSYLVNQASQDFSQIFAVAFSRLSGALASHWIYTGLVSLGVFTIYSKNRLFSKKWGFFWVIAAVLLHFVWDTPINDFQLGELSIVADSLTAFSLFLIFQIIYQLWQQEKSSLIG